MLYGVESICRVLPIAPSTYYRHAQRLKQPDLRAKRCASDELLLCQIQQVWQESSQIYGYRKVWRQLQRQGINAARCTVARLMRKHSIQGVWRGKGKRTIVCDPELQRAADLVNRQFRGRLRKRKKSYAKTGLASRVVGVPLVTPAGLRLGLVENSVLCGDDPRSCTHRRCAHRQQSPVAASYGRC